MMPGIINDATRIWEEKRSWAPGSQCATWNASGRRVEVWECSQQHVSNEKNKPPNSDYWRFLAQR